MEHGIDQNFTFFNKCFQRRLSVCLPASLCAHILSVIRTVISHDALLFAAAQIKPVVFLSSTQQHNQVTENKQHQHAGARGFVTAVLHLMLFTLKHCLSFVFF